MITGSTGICTRRSDASPRRAQAIGDLPEIYEIQRGGRGDGRAAPLKSGKLPLFATPQPANYGVILADPPWRFKTYSARGKGRSAEAHYDCLSIGQIEATPVRQWVAGQREPHPQESYSTSWRDQSFESVGFA